MYWLIFLILYPLAVALVLLLLSDGPKRNAVVKFSALALSLGSIVLVAVNFHRDIQCFKANSLFIDRLMLYLEIILAAYIFYAGLKYRRYLASILIAIQAILVIYFEIFLRQGIRVENNLFVDKLSVIMALVIGIIGGITAVYALGYMQDFHERRHQEVKDNRRFFFFIIFVFLSAMFGIIFSNNLLWFYFFWEITTLCSFLLIGYNQTKEARANSFQALEFNLLGAVAFLLAIVYLYFSAKTIELDKIIMAGKSTVLVGAALLCFSGLIKSAQFPFSSWLIGAMVAPLPVSSLLHASTMVKAGVYLMLRFALVLEGSLTGYMLALAGGVTFLIASLIAISESEAKKVLAYSTLANLGLIVLCAGVGTYEAMWAALLLIIFHAVTKCLLFLSVGVVEQKIQSMNIEDMSGLIVRMPKISIMLQLGMAGMFLAPFGMLISKWLVLRALIDYNPLLAVFVVFGGAATVFFWVKWMGKLISVVDGQQNLERGISISEWLPLFLLSFITVGLCLFFPLISAIVIEPYLIEAYDRAVVLSHENITIMSLMMAMVMLFPLSFLNRGRRVKVVDAYLGGANTSNRSSQFLGAASRIKDMEMKNYYLNNYFGQHRLFKFGAAVSSVLILAMFVLSWLLK